MSMVMAAVGAAVRSFYGNGNVAVHGNSGVMSGSGIFDRAVQDGARTFRQRTRPTGHRMMSAGLRVAALRDDPAIGQESFFLQGI